MSSIPLSQQAPLSRSFDGYIRTTFEDFSSLDFCQRRAWQDRELCDELIEDDVPAFQAGYCEWATDKLPHQVSIGWGWFRWIDGRTLLAPGGMTSNLMLVDRGSYDLGPHKTHELLQSWLTGEQWQRDMLISSNTCLYSTHRSPN